MFTTDPEPVFSLLLEEKQCRGDGSNTEALVDGYVWTIVHRQERDLQSANLTCLQYRNPIQYPDTWPFRYSFYCDKLYIT